MKEESGTLPRNLGHLALFASTPLTTWRGTACFMRAEMVGAFEGEGQVSGMGVTELVGDLLDEHPRLNKSPGFAHAPLGEPSMDRHAESLLEIAVELPAADARISGQPFHAVARRPGAIVPIQNPFQTAAHIKHLRKHLRGSLARTHPYARSKAAGKLCKCFAVVSTRI